MRLRIEKRLTFSFVSFATAALLLLCSFVICTDAYADGAAAVSTSQASTPNIVKKKPIYTISPKSKPLNKKITKSKTYTKQLKHYWLIKGYMDLFEKKGGGTLIFKKGTYNLPCSIQVPSNVTLVFNNGVVIKKTAKTGTKRVKANTPLFQLISPKKYNKKGAVGKYGGSKNISFVGKGNVTFNMNNRKTGCAIVMGHNQNVVFSNITFKNANAHFFELDASKNVTIDNCKFIKLGGGKTTEAINLDTPDKKTGGFSFRWSKMDKTPNLNITIQNCTFSDMSRAIGTHKYSQKNGNNVMHENIKILNNTFTDIKGVEGIIMTFNWKDVTITGNKFIGKGAASKTYGVTLMSAVGAVVTNNTFSKVETPIIIRRGFTASGYALPAAVSVSQDQINQMARSNSYEKSTVTKGHIYVTMDSAWVAPTAQRTLYDLPSF